MRRHRNSRRGSAMTEFALASTVLILMVAGGTDLARIFYLGTAMTQAAKAGAQYGSYSSGNAANATGITAAAQAAAPGVTMTVTSSRTCACGETIMTCGQGSCPSEPKMYVQVRASGQFHAFMPFWGMSQNVPVGATSRFRVK